MVKTWEVILPCVLLDPQGHVEGTRKFTYYAKAEDRKSAQEKAESWLPEFYVLEGKCTIEPLSFNLTDLQKTAETTMRRISRTPWGFRENPRDNKIDQDTFGKVFGGGN